MLDIAIINLKEAGLHHELGDGSLYTKLQRKLPQSMLASYQRWVFENNISESVVALRTWVIQESEFQTVASKIIHGLTGIAATSQPSQSFPQNNNQRAFFGETGNNYCGIKTVACQLCRKRHGIWKCQTFIEKNVSKRWNLAKLFQLCYRCLAEGHYGNSCPRSQPCGQNGCLKLHHRLLHQDDCQSKVTEQTQSNTKPNIFGNAEPNQGRPESGAYLIDSATFGMEGNGREKQTTMMAQECIETEFIALRTVPVILRNGSRSLKVNALLDDASTKTYVSEEVAAELGLRGKMETVTVNVLNGQVKTPTDIELKSVTGNVRMKVTAYTATRVTGNMSVIDWNGFKRRSPHLEKIDFSRRANRPIVDILIGLDCAELHCSTQENRGGPG